MNRIGTCGTGLLAPFGIREDVDHVLQHFFSDVASADRSAAKFNPSTSVLEKEKEFEVSVELPGMDSEDISVEFNDGSLEISGEKKIAEVSEEDTLHFSHRTSGEFKRSFSFPIDVDFENINAEFSKGVLTVTIPKSEKAVPKKIEVKVS